MQVAQETFYTRGIHGSRPVRYTPPPKRGWGATFEVLDSTGVVQREYHSQRDFFVAETGRPRSTNQYFGIYTPGNRVRGLPLVLNTVPPECRVLEVFKPTLWSPGSITVVANSDIVIPASSPVTVGKPPKRLPPVQDPNGPPLGIDLAVRGKEVRKLFYAGFGARVAGHGYDPEEVLQDIYRGILARNKGICPFDGGKRSSFGHYCYLVIEGIINNFHRKEARRRSIEQVGLAAPMSMKEDAGSSGMVDAASVAETSLISNEFSPSISDGGMPDAVRRLSNHLEKKRAQGITVDPLAVTVAKSLAEGFNRQEIAKTLDVTQGRVNQAITSLREHAGDWF